MKVKQVAEAQQAQAIARCMDDPAYAAKVHAGEWCATCEMSRPCLCDRDQAVSEMRTFYEANRRTLFRSEPKLIGSWGRDMDGLMTGLYNIATRQPS